MDNKKENSPAGFPEEMPMGEEKKYENGVIESVVRNEIEIKSATAPAMPHNTDNINTEFAKQVNKEI